MKAKVFVTLKHGVLDPQGKAVASGLKSLGYPEVKDVRQGKYFELEIENGENVSARVAGMCERLLANLVMEDYRIELSE